MMNKDLIHDIISLAYKVIPLPSGCANCWGGLHEGCTDECRKSSQLHHERIETLKNGILELMDKYRDQLKLSFPKGGD
jgi:hypothetical protein